MNGPTTEAMNVLADASQQRVTGRLEARANLTALEFARMHRILDAHFRGVSPEQFRLDVSEKNWVLLLERGRELVGFSTMLVYETCVDNQPLSVVCSGDTIVDPSAWNSAALPREWIAAVKRLRARFSNGPYYWLLITSGFRTYRLLSTFWRNFWPRFDQSTPEPMHHLLATLAAERFGARYSRGDGIVRFENPQILRAELAGVPPERLADPHVEFFVRCNPFHSRGDELACLCELDDSNLTRAGERMVFGAGGRPR